MKIQPKYFVFAVVYLGLMGYLYQDALSFLTRTMGNPNTSYTYLVPLVVAYLVWDQRQRLSGLKANASWYGLVLMIPALGLYWLGELGGEFFSLYLSLWLTLVCLLWVHLGWQWIRALSFPLFISLFVFPPPAFVINNLSLRLKLISSELGVGMMQAMNMTAYREGNVIDLGFTSLQVVDACSGLRYLFPVILLGLILAYFFKGPLWKKAILVLSSIPLVVLSNGIRIAGTGFLYQFFGSAVAEGFFHDLAGMFTFGFALACLLPEMWLLSRLPGQKKEQPESRSSTSTAPGRSPGILQSAVPACLLVITLVISQSVDFREKTPIVQPLSQFPLEVGPWTGKRQAMEQKFVDALSFSDYTMIDYSGPGRVPVNFYVAYYASQRKGNSIHSPESCLPGGGWQLQESGRMTLVDVDGGELNLNRALIEKPGARQLTYYWFPQRGRVLNSLIELKLFTFWDALIHQRTDGALVRFVTPLSSGESVATADKRLQELVRELVPELSKFLPGEDA